MPLCFHIHSWNTIAAAAEEIVAALFFNQCAWVISEINWSAKWDKVENRLGINQWRKQWAVSHIAEINCVTARSARLQIAKQPAGKGSWTNQRANHWFNDIRNFHSLIYTLHLTKVNNISKYINSAGSQTRNVFLYSNWDKTDHHLTGSLERMKYAKAKK